MKIEILPAIDLLNGKCVRLTKGEYESRKIYSNDPLEVALSYAEKGFRRVHIVDLDGAREQSPQNLQIVEKIVSLTNLDVQYGGGIKSDLSIRQLFDCGVRRAICGTIAITKPSLFNQWLEAFGCDRILLGADVKNRKIAINGWIQTSEMDLLELIKKFPTLTQVICTDISKDGTLEGPNFDLYCELQKKFPAISFTASGGISSMKDLERLDGMNISSVIVGKAIYENRIKLEDLC